MKKYFTFNKTKVCFYTFGSPNNQAILFLHGWASNSSLWINIFKQLKNNYYLVFLDFPPFGNSSHIIHAWDINAYTNCALKLITKLQLNKCNIISHSFGFRIALSLCLKQCNVNKIVSICGAGIERKSLKTKVKIALYKFKKFLVKLKLIKQLNLQKYGSKDYIKLCPILKQTFNNIVTYNFLPYLKYINNSILLLYAKDDDQISIKQAKTFNKKLSNSSLYLFSGGGHYLFISNPTAIINAINIFFKKEN